MLITLVVAGGTSAPGLVSPSTSPACVCIFVSNCAKSAFSAFCSSYFPTQFDCSSASLSITSKLVRKEAQAKVHSCSGRTVAYRQIGVWESWYGAPLRRWVCLLRLREVGHW